MRYWLYLRDVPHRHITHAGVAQVVASAVTSKLAELDATHALDFAADEVSTCLLYTSDAADE